MKLALRIALIAISTAFLTLVVGYLAALIYGTLSGDFPLLSSSNGGHSA
jgi:hypothetical protein